MMSKALKLIKAAETTVKAQLTGNNQKRGNPFGKPWGLQADGDLWEQAWKAVLKRGWENQTLRKVKGHATEDDIEKGASNREDKRGNDLSDGPADKGVEAIAGIGLVKLGKWLEARQRNYKQLMNRVHKMIAAVTVAEKKMKGRRFTAYKKPPLPMTRLSG